MSNINVDLSTGNKGITKNSFAAALGLPREFHSLGFQAVYREWRSQVGTSLQCPPEFPLCVLLFTQSKPVVPFFSIQMSTMSLETAEDPPQMSC